MKSDLYLEAVKLVPGFNDTIIEIAKLQASRDNPRRLVSMTYLEETILLAFELIDQIERKDLPDEKPQ